jgi:hypothetical protein
VHTRRFFSKGRNTPVGGFPPGWGGLAVVHKQVADAEGDNGKRDRRDQVCRSVVCVCVFEREREREREVDVIRYADLFFVYMFLTLSLSLSVSLSLSRSRSLPLSRSLCMRACVLARARARALSLALSDACTWVLNSPVLLEQILCTWARLVLAPVIRVCVSAPAPAEHQHERKDGDRAAVKR